MGSIIAGLLCFMGMGLTTGRAEAGYTAFIDLQRLFITGDDASDDMALVLQAGDPTMLVVDVGADGSADFTFNRGQFTQIFIDAGGGDDRVTIDETNGSFTESEAATIDGGDGDDTLTGGAGVEVFIGGAGKDIVDGNGGSDVADLGDDSDTFRWEPGDGNDIVDGQSGNDVLAFNGAEAAESFSFFAVGPRLRLARNLDNVLMDLDGIERVDLFALGGADQVHVNDLAGTDAAMLVIDCAGAPDGTGGDNQADTIIVNGTAGEDRIQVSPAPKAIPGGNGSPSARSAVIEAAAPLARPTLVSGLKAKIRVENGEPALDVVVINGVGGDAVRVNGSAAADGMNLLPSLLPGYARVEVEGMNAGVDVTGAQLALNGLAGNDQISSAGNVAGLNIPIRLEGSGGNDVIRGSNAGEIISGGAGDDVLDGNQGIDTISMGDGNDVFVWDPGDGSDVVEGDAGADTLAFNGSGASENMDLSANGDRLRFTRNVANIVMDVAGVEEVALRALGGVDNVTVHDLTATDVAVVSVNLAAVGGAGDAQIDSVTVAGTPQSDTFEVEADGDEVVVTGLGAEVRVAGGELANDRLVVTGIGNDLVNVNGTELADTMSVFPSLVPGHAQVIASGFTIPVEPTGAITLSLNGLDGPDDLNSAGNVAGTGIPIRFNGGEGDDIIRGSNAADTLIGGPGKDFLDGNQGADTVFMGPGDDTFQWDPGDGSDVVEGEEDLDTLAFNGSNAGEIMNLSANGGHLRFTRNVASITMDVDGVEEVKVRTLGGADNVTVHDLAATKVTLVNLDLAAVFGGNLGDNLADLVTIEGTSGADIIDITADAGAAMVTGLATSLRITHSEATFDDLVVNGLAGTDTITQDADVTNLIGITINQD